MPGTLTISTLSDGTNSTSATNAIQGSAKAWVNFNGVTAAIRASYNVGSITKNGTGDYTVNFTTAMPDANYSGVVTSGNATSSGSFATNAPWAASTASAYRIGITTVTTTPQLVDAPFVQVAIFR